MDEEERILRTIAAFAYSDVNHLYQDDGELQDNFEVPSIDWMRDAPSAIQAKIRQRALNKLQKEQAHATEAD